MQNPEGVGEIGPEIASPATAGAADTVMQPIAAQAGEPKEPTAENEPYKVGYGRPPKHTQFKTGQSGNPTGRRFKPLNVKNEIRRQFLEKAAVRNGSKTQYVTRINLLVNRLITNGIKGDTRSALAAYKLAVEHRVLDARDKFEVNFSTFSPEEMEQVKKTHKIYDKHGVWEKIFPGPKRKGG